tara:strand:- start:62 stop:418 length:357 start_codon:yes stop_codon:yes gene_type:complete
MNKASGIIGLIGGILGFIAAVITLMTGGLVAGLESVVDEGGDAGSTIVKFGWLGILASFLTIIFSAMMFSATKKLMPLLLIVSSIVGAIFGGTFVAVCMVLCIIAGIIGFIGVGQKSA